MALTATSHAPTAAAVAPGSAIYKQSPNNASWAEQPQQSMSETSKPGTLSVSASSDSNVDGNTVQSSSDAPTPTTRQRKYERKTKRFIWPDDLHRLFVAAIFDGIEQTAMSFFV